MVLLREEKILKVKYKYLDYNENQEPYFKVCIVDEYGSELVGLLAAEDATKSDLELVELVKEQFYQRTYLNRAENEKFSQFDEAIKQANEATARANEAIEKMEHNSAISRATVLDLISKLYEQGVLKDEDDAEDESDDSAKEETAEQEKPATPDEKSSDEPKEQN